MNISAVTIFLARVVVYMYMYCTGWCLSDVRFSCCTDTTGVCMCSFIYYPGQKKRNHPEICGEKNSVRSSGVMLD